MCRNRSFASLELIKNKKNYKNNKTGAKRRNFSYFFSNVSLASLEVIKNKKNTKLDRIYRVSVNLWTISSKIYLYLISCYFITEVKYEKVKFNMLCIWYLLFARIVPEFYGSIKFGHYFPNNSLTCTFSLVGRIPDIISDQLYGNADDVVNSN